jgi:hypothetical protein
VAARANNASGYAAAEGRVTRSQRAVQAALNEFEQLGYSLS